MLWDFLKCDIRTSSWRLRLGIKEWSSISGIFLISSSFLRKRYSMLKFELQRVTLFCTAHRSIMFRNLAAFFKIRSSFMISCTFVIMSLNIRFDSNHVLTAKLNLWLAHPTRGIPVKRKIFWLVTQLSPFQGCFDKINMLFCIAVGTLLDILD